MDAEAEARRGAPAEPVVAVGGGDAHSPHPTGEEGAARHRASYTCRRCRALLFAESDVVPHDPLDGAKKTFKYRRGGPSRRDGDGDDDNGSGGSGAISDAAAATATCTSLFLDPDQTPWVVADVHEASVNGAAVEPDTLYCPNPRCRAKLGTQSWTGSQCSCGAWVTPAFRIHARAVDKMLCPAAPAQ
ncbi:hypothetical protein NESM_000685200 [Novymonas esmeraldas]|uniref:Dual specificity protein phosphatase 12 n=1 Tax=Novymonas esmeraldas TaxID=1808958 RepID=A0AAW0EV47_9TRYP